MGLVMAFACLVIFLYSSFFAMPSSEAPSSVGGMMVKILGIGILHIGGALSLALTTWSLVPRVPYRHHATAWGVVSLLLAGAILITGDYS